MDQTCDEETEERGHRQTPGLTGFNLVALDALRLLVFSNAAWNNSYAYAVGKLQPCDEQFMATKATPNEACFRST